MMLSPGFVYRLLFFTFASFFIFAYLTDLHHLGLASARQRDTWQLWRHIVVDSWLLIATMIFFMQKQQASKQSLQIALLISCFPAISFVVFFIGGELGQYAIIGTATTYVLISGLLCMTLKNHYIAGFLGAILMFVQFVVDVIVLGIAGQFRIH
jgi:hypothetical protein